MMIIPIHLDYGAEGALCYAPFESHAEIIHLKFLEPLQSHHFLIFAITRIQANL